MSFHLVDYHWLLWALAFALASLSIVIVASRLHSLRLWLAATCAGLCAAIFLGRFAMHWLVGAECIDDRCRLPAPFSDILSTASTVEPWIAALGAALALHFVLRVRRLR